jgi:hypothetical protein
MRNFNPDDKGHILNIDKSKRNYQDFVEKVDAKSLDNPNKQAVAN